jgi:RimJ/RimL family protein N-acetyltransferase
MLGERVFLRPFEKDDAVKDVLMLRQETETFFDDGRRIRSSIRAHQQHIKFAEEAYPEWIRFAICLRETGELIGSNGIDDIDYVHGIAETETMLTNPAYRNSGYGSEAKQLLLGYAFDQLGLHMVQSWVWGPNARSAAALRKQGYRDAGQCSWTGAKNGEVTNDLVFDYLASEWRAARR